MSKLVLEKNNIPKNWIFTQIQEVCETKSGGTPSRKNLELYEGDVPWVKSGELSDSLISSCEETISELGLQKSNATIFPKGTILMAMYGATIGKLGILNLDASTNQAICAFFNDKRILNSKYLFYFLKHNKENLIKSGFGGAQNNISQEIIKKVVMPIPPLKEQERIVEKIEEFFSLIDLTNQPLEKIKIQLKQFKQSLLKYAFEGLLIENDKEKISKDWRIFELVHVADVIDPHPSHRAPPKVSEGFPFLGIGDIDEEGKMDVNHSRKISERFVLQQEQSYEINSNSIGYGRVGTVGKVVKLRKQKFRYALSPTLAVINPKHTVDASFLFYQLKSNFFVQQVSQNITGTTRSAIGILKLRKILVRISPLDEQKKIVSKLDQCFSLVDKIEKLIDLFLLSNRIFKNSILKQAFKGRLVPQDPNDEPAEILLQKIKREKELLEQKQKIINSKSQKKRRKNVK